MAEIDRLRLTGGWSDRQILQQYGEHVRDGESLY